MLALCERNCKYRNYNKETKRVECECETKKEFPKFAQEVNEAIKANKDLNLKEFLHQFVDVIKHSNFFYLNAIK